MSFRPQPPLTDRELRIIRGMIDEFEFRSARRRVLGGFVTDLRVVTVVLGGVILVALNAVTLILTLTGRR